MASLHDDSISANFSPIREEPDFEEEANSTKMYNLRPKKRISFSSTPKKPQTLRYASCSNLADLNSKQFAILCIHCGWAQKPPRIWSKPAINRDKKCVQFDIKMII